MGSMRGKLNASSFAGSGAGLLTRRARLTAASTFENHGPEDRKREGDSEAKQIQDRHDERNHSITTDDPVEDSDGADCGHNCADYPGQLQRDS